MTISLLLVYINGLCSSQVSFNRQVIWLKRQPFSSQPKGKKAKGKKVAPAPSVAKKHEAKKVVNPLFEKRPKNFGIGKCSSGMRKMESACDVNEYLLS